MLVFTCGKGFASEVNFLIAKQTTRSLRSKKSCFACAPAMLRCSFKHQP